MTTNASYIIFENLMRKKGVNSALVARSTGISPATISAWKKDIYVPKLEKMQIIADFFGVSVDYLLGKAEGNNNLPLETQQAIAFYDKFNQLRADQRAIVENMINFMLAQNSIPSK